MYQTVIRDPGGGITRIIDCSYETVVNGSLLIVPADTVAFVSINGRLSEPYPSGSYEIFTGVDPFFVNLRHLMTKGDPGVSVLVFYISDRKIESLQLGTGEIPFMEKRFHLTMNALVSCQLIYHILDPSLFLSRIVGAYSTEFSREDYEPSLREAILAPIRQTLSRVLAEHEITAFNQNLRELSAAVYHQTAEVFRSIGLSLDRLDITAIALAEEDRKRLQEIEDISSKGIMENDLELDHLTRIFGGDIDKRILSEMLTGLPSRGTAGHNLPPSSHQASTTSPIVQMMMLSQLMPFLRENVSSLTQHTDRFTNTSGNENHEEPESSSSRSLPSRLRRCPSCNGRIDRKLKVCPICGRQL